MSDVEGRIIALFRVSLYAAPEIPLVEIEAVSCEITLLSFAVDVVLLVAIARILLFVTGAVDLLMLKPVSPTVVL